MKFSEYKYDLSLEHDGSNRFIVWIIACLVFVATLSMFSALASKQMLADWQTYAGNHATIEIPFSESAEDTALEAAEALMPLRAVINAEIIPTEETTALVMDSLGQDTQNDLNTATLPLPVLIDVTFAEDIDPSDFELIREKLAALNAGANLHLHDDWAGDVLSYGEMLYFGAVILLLLMTAMTVLTLIWVLVSRVNIHHDEIEILNTVGADDGYIARQFQHFALSRTLIGAVAGIVSAAIAMGIIDWQLDISDILPDFSIVEIIGWLIMPLGLCLFIAYLTARITLQRTLSGL